MRNKLTAACITVQFQFGEYWIIIFMTLSCRVVDDAGKTERRLPMRLVKLYLFVFCTHASSGLKFNDRITQLIMRSLSFLIFPFFRVAVLGRK